MYPATDDGTDDHDKHEEETTVSTTITAQEPEVADDVTVSENSDAAVATSAEEKPGGRGRRISISVRALAHVAVIIALIAATGVTTWLYLGARSTLEHQNSQAANNTRAEQIALGYAVNAAIMDYKDLGPWKQKLVSGTTRELNAKLTEASTAMEQILLPLQWSSTAQPIAAKVRSRDNGVYVVDAFISVMTKTVQAADSLQSTATYTVTIDSNNAWLISDVGGIASVVAPK
jgi:Mce-associated membrane protein